MSEPKKDERDEAPDEYDLIVIGAGPGGYIGAIRAAQLGMRVACVEKEAALGGTCLRIGCIPSKALLDSSELFAEARDHFAEHGILVEPPKLDLDAFMRRKMKVVEGLTGGVASLFKKNGIDRYHGTGTITGKGVVRVSDGDEREIRGKNLLIATGSDPAPLPDVPFDGNLIVSSDQAIAFETVPERLLVVGSGAIGLELGSVWARLGSKVRVVEILDRVVPTADAEMSRALEKALKKQGLSFQLSATATDFDVRESSVAVTIDAGKKKLEEEFDMVLVAIGRRPYTASLGLEGVGIETDDRGRIPVDDRFQTSVPGIYAVGDVIEGPMLAHKAEDEGVACVEGIAGMPVHVRYDAIPSVVYTWPELASVGATEAEAEERGSIRVGRFPFMANGRARALGVRDGLVKIIADAETDRVLGVHIVGPRASDLIAEAVLAIEFGASSEDVARTCHAHPTLSEAVKEAALDVDGRKLNL